MIRLTYLTRTLLGATEGGYPYMSALLQLAHLPTHCPHPLIPWPPCPSPIRLPALAVALRSHPDQQFVTFVLQRLTYGFRIGFARQRKPLPTLVGKISPICFGVPTGYLPIHQRRMRGWANGWAPPVHT